MLSYINSQYIRDFNKSLRLAKFTSYFTWTYRLLFFGNYTSLNTVFICCHRIKKPNFNDVCVLFKHSNFCSGYWKCILRGQDFKIFGRGACPQTPLKTHTFSTQKVQGFSFSTFSKASVTYLKPYGKPWYIVTKIQYWHKA